MGGYPQQDSGGGGFRFIIIIFFLFIIVSGGYFIVYKKMSLGEIKDSITSKVSLPTTSSLAQGKATAQQQQRKIVIPPGNLDWCRLQEMPARNLYRARIAGFDNLDQCCLFRGEGYSCEENKTISVENCFIGNVGGRIVYSKVDGYHTNYEEFKSVRDSLVQVEAQC